MHDVYVQLFIRSTHNQCFAFHDTFIHQISKIIQVKMQLRSNLNQFQNIFIFIIVCISVIQNKLFS